MFGKFQKHTYTIHRSLLSELKHCGVVPTVSLERLTQESRVSYFDIAERILSPNEKLQGLRDTKTGFIF